MAEPRERLPPRCPPVRRGGPRRLAPASAGSAPDLWVRAPRTPPPAPSGGAAPFSRSSAPLERRPHHRRTTANFPSRRMLLRAADRRGPRGGQRGHAAAWAARQPISPSVVESAADGQPTAPVGPRLPRPLSGVTLAGRLGRRGVTCYVQTDASRGLERENGGDLLRGRARGILPRRTPYGPPAAQPRWLGGEPAPIDAWT